MGSFCKITLLVMSTLSLVIKEHDKKAAESQLDYEDRMTEVAYWKLRDKKKLTVDEKAEFKELATDLGMRQGLRVGAVPIATTDKQLQEAVKRLHRELMEEYKGDTPFKRILIDRIVSAWSMAFSYERMFYSNKYHMNEDDSRATYEYGKDKTRYLKEVRHGIETANDQIIRLTQTLQNLCYPPIQIKAKNAFFAQNQQINQGVSPKDLANSSEPSHAPSLPH